MHLSEFKVAVIIPAYRVKNHILEVIQSIGPEVNKIIVIDDLCPEESGFFVRTNCSDSRVIVIFHSENQGVGGAVMSGYSHAMKCGMNVLVKVDGDGQMDPTLIPEFIYPIISGEADYTKGNRFNDLESISSMPKIRLFGNAILSLMCKLSSGYWNIFDPTNGYTAIHSDVARLLPFHKVSRRYFFETDMLFRLNTLRAVVVDVPMVAKYGNEVSNLRVSQIAGEFLCKHIRNFYKRIFYNYYLRDMSLASIELPLSILFLGFGIIYGSYHWFLSSHNQLPTPAGTVMMAALPIIAGIQFFLGFVGYDISSIPNRPIHRKNPKNITEHETPK